MTLAPTRWSQEGRLPWVRSPQLCFNFHTQRLIVCFMIGFVNSSLYTGDIDYNDIPDGSESYWLQTMSCECICSCNASWPYLNE